MMEVEPANIVFQHGATNRRVAVIVPLYNYSHLIVDALSSVATQTFEDIVLIVVDDCSTDDSRNVVADWMRRADAPHLSLLLLANERNAGLSVTRNTGIAHALSDYCFFLDADNLLFASCIEKHVRALDARLDHVGAYAVIEEFGGASRLIGANVFSRDRLKHGNYIDAMTMLRRSAVEKLGGFHPIKHGWEDYELWLRLCEAGEKLLHIPEILSRYRNHQNSMLRQKTNVGQNLVDLSRNIAELHPWVQLDAPRPQRCAPVAHQRNASSKAAESPADTSRPASGYARYEQRIFAKLDSLAHRQRLPAYVEVDADYTGPAHGSPFDPFVTRRQREDTAKHVKRMLQSGIAAINPRPGVHAARDEAGELIRYRSILSRDRAIDHLPPTMLIHIHAFYPDVVDEMLDYFAGDARHGRFLVTTTTPKNYDAIRTILYERHFSNHEVVLIENRGRDIGPFLDHATDYAVDGEVICHIHTKKSADIDAGYGEKWRKSLYGTLLTQTAIDAFADRRLGLLFPETPRTVGWGKNRAFCEQIATRLQRRLKPHPGPIPVGNMFFARVEVARAMRDATRDMDWPREPVPYDGTILHAIERMWPVACEYAGFEWAAIYTRDDMAGAAGTEAGDGPC